MGLAWTPPTDPMGHQGYIRHLGGLTMGSSAGRTGDGEAPRPCQMLADCATTLLVGDEDERADLVEAAQANQANPAATRSGLLRRLEEMTP